MSDARHEVRADREGLREVIDSGMRPDMVVLLLVTGFRDSMLALMEALPRGRVSDQTRIQFMALATVIENTHAALTRELIDEALPDEVRDLLAGLASVIHDAASDDNPEAESYKDRMRRKRGVNGDDPKVE